MLNRHFTAEDAEQPQRTQSHTAPSLGHFNSGGVLRPLKLAIALVRPRGITVETLLILCARNKGAHHP